MRAGELRDHLAALPEQAEVFVTVPEGGGDGHPELEITAVRMVRLPNLPITYAYITTEAEPA